MQPKKRERERPTIGDQVHFSLFKLMLIELNGENLKTPEAQPISEHLSKDLFRNPSQGRVTSTAEGFLPCLFSFQNPV
jgi:hypothetical protein